VTSSSRIVARHRRSAPYSETPIARLDLLDLSPADRTAIDHGNAEALSRKPA
jgi:hypothetical protein